MTRQELFEIMESAYAGSGSTVEGSFAGDILRACADGCAELWSTEIDGLEQRAFVTTAQGQWLTWVCADRGVERREGESDETLRRRALESLSRQGASGNVDDYQSWCARVPELLRVRVLPLHRGPGTVDIVALDQDGRAPAETVLAKAQQVVDENRPIGADAQLLAPTETPLHVEARLALGDSGDLSAVQAAFTAALTDFCRACALTARTVSYAKVSALLLECPGVADVEGFSLCGGAGSVELADTEIPVPGTVTLREVGT